MQELREPAERALLGGRRRVSWKPAKLRYVVRWGRIARYDARLPDEVEHARRLGTVSVRVQVGPEELAWLDLEAGLLAQLPAEAVERMLALVEKTSERVPEPGVRIMRSAREQHASRVVDDECGHGGRRLGVVNEPAFHALDASVA